VPVVQAAEIAQTASPTLTEAAPAPLAVSEIAEATTPAPTFATPDPWADFDDDFMGDTGYAEAAIPDAELPDLSHPPVSLPIDPPDDFMADYEDQAAWGTPRPVAPSVPDFDEDFMSVRSVPTQRRALSPDAIPAVAAEPAERSRAAAERAEDDGDEKTKKAKKARKKAAES